MWQARASCKLQAQFAMLCVANAKTRAISRLREIPSFSYVPRGVFSLRTS